jgi:hypothetical protein
MPRIRGACIGVRSHNHVELVSLFKNGSQIANGVLAIGVEKDELPCVDSLGSCHQSGTVSPIVRMDDDLDLRSK